ncbi:MAG TPA: TetR/AcrR family transcriptional regulator [Ktedonobacterales bacterium]
MNSAREQLIETASSLFEAQGYHATGLSQILAASGAPKGSLYHYFPGGKEELGAAAIAHAGAMIAERLGHSLATVNNPAEAIARFVENVAHHVETSGFSAGGPLMMLALETVNSSERLNRACRAAYGQIQDAFQAKLEGGGYGQPDARQLAAFVTCAIEGGIILSRTQHSGDPLRMVARALEQHIRSVPPSAVAR